MWICSAKTLSVRRLLHSRPGDPPFGIYKTIKDEDGKFHSTLQLRERVQAAANAGNREYKGEEGSTKNEAEESAARLFWADPGVQEKAAKLPPSNKMQGQKNRWVEICAKRKARRYGTGVAGL